MLSKIRSIINNYEVQRMTKECYKNAIIGNTYAGIGPIINESGKKNRVIIGHHCRVNGTLYCKENGRIEVDNYSTIQLGVKIECLEYVKIGSYVGIGADTTITDNTNHIPDPIEMVKHRIRVAPDGPGYPGLGNGWELSESSPVIIEDVVWVGTKCAILKGVTIGEGSIVARNSVVTKNVPPYSIVAGVPARVVKKLKKPDYKYFDPDYRP